MRDYIYTAYPAVCDAIQAEWDYDCDVSFVQQGHARQGTERMRCIVVQAALPETSSS